MRVFNMTPARSASQKAPARKLDIDLDAELELEVAA